MHNEYKDQLALNQTNLGRISDKMYKSTHPPISYIIARSILLIRADSLIAIASRQRA